MARGSDKVLPAETGKAMLRDERARRLDGLRQAIRTHRDGLLSVASCCWADDDDALTDAVRRLSDTCESEPRVVHGDTPEVTRTALHLDALAREYGYARPRLVAIAGREGQRDEVASALLRFVAAADREAP